MDRSRNMSGLSRHSKSKMKRVLSNCEEVRRAEEVMTKEMDEFKASLDPSGHIEEDEVLKVVVKEDKFTKGRDKNEELDAISRVVDVVIEK